jgi:hypothetical protein
MPAIPRVCPGHRAAPTAAIATAALVLLAACSSSSTPAKAGSAPTGPGSTAVGGMLSAGPTPPPATTAPTSSGTCLVGIWTQTGEHYVGDSSIGGGGTVVTITPSHITQVYNNVTLATDVWNGTETATSTITQTSPTTGTIAFADITSTITIRDAQGKTTSPQLAPYSLTWTCSGSTLSLDASEAIGTLVADYQRTAN